jgi:hypothetical protein
MILDDIRFIRAYLGDPLPIINIAYDSNSRPEYRGVAVRGTADSASRWLIEKITYDGNGLVTTHRLSPQNSIWDNRTSLTYA